MTENVVAWFEVCGDLYEPGAVVGNEYVACPEAWVRSVNVTDLVDLEELERRLVNRLAVPVARREIVKDRAMVRVGPSDGPLDGDGVARVDGGMATGRGGVLVADDVAGLVGVRGDEAVVGVGGCPAYDDRGIGFVRVGSWVVALPVDAIDYEVVDVGVSDGGGGQGEAAQDCWQDGHSGPTVLDGIDWRLILSAVCSRKKRQEIIYRSALFDRLPQLLSLDNLAAIKDHIFDAYSFIHHQNTGLSTHT